MPHPLPPDTDDAGLTPAASEGEPSAAELVEMVLAERDALSQAVQRYGPFSSPAEAHAGILRLLIRKSTQERSERSGSPLELAAKLADVFPSGSATLESLGAVDRAAALVNQGLGPLNTEVLRPQSEFNRALVEVLGQLLGARLAADASWVRARLEPLAEPTAFQVRSHRDNLLGRLVETAKRSWLTAAGPLFDKTLERQRAWNHAVIELLESRQRLDSDEKQLERALEEVTRLSELGAGAAGDDAGARFIAALFVRQARFNRHIAAMLRDQLEQAQPVADYPAWAAARETARERMLSPRLKSIANPPRIAVVIDGRTEDGAALAATVASLEAQLYRNWERFKEGAPADLVAFVEAGDTLPRTALAEMALRAVEQPAASAFFSDEDRWFEGKRADPFFKPDFSFELLTGCDLVSRLLVVRQAHAEAVRAAPNRYAATLALHKQGVTFGHVREVLYTRVSNGERRLDFVPRQGRVTLERFFAESGVPATIDETPNGLAVRYVSSARPLVSIIVPFRDHPELLEQLARSLKTTHYDHYELILVSNQSREAKTHQLLRSLEKESDARVLEWNHPFNYPAINNFAAKDARGDVLVFLNNDIEITDPHWLSTLIGYLEQPGVAAVGPKLVFPDGRVQHAGVVVGMGGFAGHPFAQLPDDGRWTPFGVADWPREYLALTSACLVLRRSDFEALGGFDLRFEVCGSDVDLCLRLRRQQGRNKILYVPRARLMHHESASRAGTPIPASDFWESFRSYGAWLADDPFYSPHLSLTSTAPRLKPEDEATALELALRHLGAISPRPAFSTLSSGRIASTRRTLGVTESLDCPPEAFTRHRSTPLKERPRHLTWIIPGFSHPFGGVHTLFRFADAWASEFGVKNLFVVHDNPHVSAREIAARASVLAPRSSSEFEVLPSLEAMRNLPQTDVVIATAWTSAYAALKHPSARFHAYFVQDDESLFHPAGTLSALADNTYRFGFYGLFNGRGLYEHFVAQRGMQGTWFEPSVDRAIFHAEGRSEPTGPVRLFFYARPSVDRNAFELGLEALRQVKEKLGDGVRIVCAGESWDPAWFGAEKVVENLGVLPYRETGALYRGTDVGLCFMFTRHPSYLPLELMACGATVVTNDNPANGWILTHKQNSLLTQPTASCVAERLLEAVQDRALRQRLSAAATARLASTQWEAQTRQTFEALTRAAMADSTT